MNESIIKAKNKQCTSIVFSYGEKNYIKIDEDGIKIKAAKITIDKD